MTSTEISKDVYIPNGLVVFRGAMDSDFTTEFATECSDLHDQLQHDIGSVEGVRSRVVTASLVYNRLGPRTKQVIDFLGVSGEDMIVVNRQDSYAEQDFHRDGVPSVVLYPETKGSYDYNLAPGIDRNLSIPVSAGDILISGLCGLYHRGRNSTPFIRHTFSILDRKNKKHTRLL